MTREDKTALIADLQNKFENSKFFYFTDFSTLTVEATNNFRRLCFENNVEYKVIKNKLIKKALENISGSDYAGVIEHLKGQTAVMFSEEGKVPAVVLKKFRKTNEKPLLKCAYIDTDVFVGDDQIEPLTNLKSKADMIAEVIGLLQSPMTTLMGQANSGKNTIFGLLQTLEEREEG